MKVVVLTLRRVTAEASSRLPDIVKRLVMGPA